jgi:hypothetical protein
MGSVVLTFHMVYKNNQKVDQTQSGRWILGYSKLAHICVGSTRKKSPSTIVVFVVVVVVVVVVVTTSRS